MKFNLAKYAFDSKEQFKTKLESLKDIRFEIAIELGNICLVAESISLDDVVTEAIYSDKCHVDMCWYGLDDHPFGWKSYYVEVDGNGSAKIAGLEYNDYKFSV